MRSRSLPIALACVFLLTLAALTDIATTTEAQSSLSTLGAADPGPRGGAPGAGGALASLDAVEQQLFNDALPISWKWIQSRELCPGKRE